MDIKVWWGKRKRIIFPKREWEFDDKEPICV